MPGYNIFDKNYFHLALSDNVKNIIRPPSRVSISFYLAIYILHICMCVCVEKFVELIAVGQGYGLNIRSVWMKIDINFK